MLIKNNGELLAMGRKKTYEVNLSEAERNHLENLVSKGVEKARKLTRARILLKADEKWLDREISEAFDVGESTVLRTCKKYAEQGLDVALNRRKSSRQYDLKIDGKAEAHLTALACSKPPEGRSKWTLRLLADRLVQLEEVEADSISYETVRRSLKKTLSNPGASNNG